MLYTIKQTLNYMELANQTEVLKYFKLYQGEILQILSDQVFNSCVPTMIPICNAAFHSQPAPRFILSFPIEKSP